MLKLVIWKALLTADSLAVNSLVRFPRPERGRTVKSIVSVEGNLVPSLHEFKIVSSSITRY